MWDDRDASIPALLAESIPSLVLWLTAALTFAYGVAGVGGLISGAMHRQNGGAGPGTLIFGFGLASVLGMALFKRYHRPSRRSLALHDVVQGQGVTVAASIATVAAAAGVTLAVEVVVGLIRSVPLVGALSTVVLTVFVATFLAECAIGCAYRAIRWWYRSA